MIRSYERIENKSCIKIVFTDYNTLLYDYAFLSNFYIGVLSDSDVDFYESEDDYEFEILFNYHDRYEEYL